jgi:queuine/archaeosine tRNA-ribosyltransferase
LTGFSFEVTAASGRARAGVFTTPHGSVETPAFMPVGTLATVKALDPVDLTTGLKARLNNLRFFCGEVDDRFDATTETAVRQFQKRHGLPVDGKPNEETRAKLVEVYGS